MRRMVSILFLLLLFLQSIPVLHAFSSEPHLFYVSIDEDKPSELKEVKEGKEYPLYIDHHLLRLLDQSSCLAYHTADERIYLNPFLEFNAPPPDTY